MAWDVEGHPHVGRRIVYLQMYLAHARIIQFQRALGRSCFFSGQLSEVALDK
ncbi:hypothetical protein D3C81_2084890 [compost metagenome]